MKITSVTVQQWRYCFIKRQVREKAPFVALSMSPVTQCAMCRGPWTGKSMNDLLYLNKSENIKHASFNQTYNTQSSWLRKINVLKCLNKQSKHSEINSWKKTHFVPHCFILKKTSITIWWANYNNASKYSQSGS